MKALYKFLNLSDFNPNFYLKKKSKERKGVTSLFLETNYCGMDVSSKTIVGWRQGWI